MPQNDLYIQNVDDFGHLDQIKIMGLTVYGEARGENRAGRIAVATVIMERVEHRSWDGETIEDVCLWPKQFSCFLPSDPNRPKLVLVAKDWDYHISIDQYLSACYQIARGIESGAIPRDPDLHNANCCQYLTAEAKKNATWWRSMKFIKTIGGHEFYA